MHEIDGTMLTHFTEADFALMGIPKEERNGLLSAIREQKETEYFKRLRKEAVHRVEEWKRENDEDDETPLCQNSQHVSESESSVCVRNEVERKRKG